MPPKASSYISDLDLPQQGNAEFLEKCRNLQKKINLMIAKPQIFFHSAEIYIKNILLESCNLQNCYEIEAQCIVDDFVQTVRLQAQIIYLLSMLPYFYTGKKTPPDMIKSQIENI